MISEHAMLSSCWLVCGEHNDKKGDCVACAHAESPLVSVQLPRHSVPPSLDSFSLRRSRVPPAHEPNRIEKREKKRSDHDKNHSHEAFKIWIDRPIRACENVIRGKRAFVVYATVSLMVAQLHWNRAASMELTN
jgi:hypothetical protein